MTNLVVIDLGSNSVRMQISQIDDYGGYTVLGYFREYVRLSESDSPSQRSAEHRCRTRGVDGRSNGKVSW